MDTVIEMYKKINEGLNENSQLVNEYLEDLEKQKKNEKVEKPVLNDLEGIIKELADQITRDVKESKEILANSDLSEQYEYLPEDKMQ